MQKAVTDVMNIFTSEDMETYKVSSESYQRNL